LEQSLRQKYRIEMKDSEAGDNSVKGAASQPGGTPQGMRSSGHSIFVSIPVVAVMLGGTLGVKAIASLAAFDEQDTPTSLLSPHVEQFDTCPNARGQSFWAQPIVARALL
jgi:hypothetical protein